MGSTTKKGNTANPGLQRAAEVPPPSFTVITGPFELVIHAATGNTYLGWTPTECTLRVTNTPASDLSVILRNRDVASGGQVVFRTTYGGTNEDTLALTLPADGSTVSFFVRGRFGSPSFHDQDGAISIHDAGTNAVLHQRTIMVRIRKNANALTIAERDRFLAAYASLNSNTALYQIFVDSHTNAADPEIHSRPSFLVWHRAFVLSIERELQRIDASVTMPYWRFDQTAPNVLADDFMGGLPNVVGRVNFTPTNPLRNWTIGGVTGIVRQADFNLVSGAPSLLDETATLALGTNYVNFRTMENDPHGSAHVSFVAGPIRSIGQASQDPLFFMLHCNVDRLWAKWQLTRNLWNPGDSNTYSTSGSTRPVGDALADTLWPWNGDTSRISPPSAPGGSSTGSFPQLSFSSLPSPLITVQEVIDYIGRTQGNSNNFDYDDVPFV